MTNVEFKGTETAVALECVSWSVEKENLCVDVGVVGSVVRIICFIKGIISAKDCIREGREGGERCKMPKLQWRKIVCVCWSTCGNGKLEEDQLILFY